MLRGLPSEKFFQIFVHVLPQLNRILEECELTMREWVVLSCIQEHGVQNEEGQIIIRRHDLTTILARSKFLDANITQTLDKLTDKGFIERRNLLAEERNLLSKNSVGEKRKGVMLRPEGVEKTTQFKEKVTNLVRHIISQRLN